MLPGDDFLEGRSIVLNFLILAETQSEFASYVQTFRLALAPCSQELPLSFRIPGVGGDDTKVINARLRRIAAVVNRRWAVYAPELVVEFFATDPRIYGLAQSLVANLPTASGGATFDATFGWTFGTVVGGGALEATNSGTFATPVQFRINGPVTDPVIENATQDKRLAFSTTLATGEFLDIDTDLRTVLLNGTASRYSTLINTSTWFDLQPGINEIHFVAAANSAATLSATWKSAWV